MTGTRVLHAITMLELGGAQRNTLYTCGKLDRTRFEVALACADSGELLDEARSLDDVTLFTLPYLRREVRPGADWLAFRELRRAIRTFRPDIVHTHSSKAGILGRLAARCEHVPIIIHSIHGWGFGRHQSAATRTAFLAAERLVAPFTTHFIAVARENLDEGVALRLFDRARGSVIRSGIDLEAFRAGTGGPEFRRSLGIPGDVPLVLQIACFKAQKAPERFIAMAASLATRCPDTHFVLIGDGDLRHRLEEARAAAGLAGRLHLPGWRRDVAAALAAATVVTLTSRFEGLPRVVVEALAARRAVVAMAVNGVVEVIEDGGNGFLVPEGDVAALTERVGRILDDGDLRRRLENRAGDGLDAFDRDIMVHQQEELYEELRCRSGS